MKKLKIVLFAVSLAVLANDLGAQPPGRVEVRHRVSIEVIIGARPPSKREGELMKEEEEKHPRIVAAMNEIKDTIRLLEDAADNFGGHKKEAIVDLKRSYVSLRKALYFRLYEDIR